MSRNEKRREIFEAAFASVTTANLHRVARQGVPVGWSGMKRAERRRLAKAYAAGEWRRRNVT